MLEDLKRVPVQKLNEILQRDISELREESTRIPEEIIITYPEEANVLRQRVQESMLSESDAISGVSFLSYRSFAQRILKLTGYQTINEDVSQRIVAIEAYIQSLDVHRDQTEFVYYDLEQLKNGSGYGEAFASAIRECEKANLFPEDLRKRANSPDESDEENTSGRIKDLVTVWEKADEYLNWPIWQKSGNVSEPVSPGNFLHGARRVLQNHPDAIKSNLMVLMDDPEVIERKWFHALKQAGMDTRFLSLEQLSVGSLSDDEFKGSETVDSERSGTNLLASLKENLFRLEEYKSRLGSMKLDEAQEEPEDEETGVDCAGVSLEIYNSFESEIEQAGHWILNQIQKGISPDKIGVIILDPKGVGTLHAIFRWLEEKGDLKQIPLSLQGRPAVELPGGTVIQMLFRTIKNFLPQEKMVQLIPKISRELSSESNNNSNESYDAYISPSQWRELIYEGGMLGGSRARPEDANSWTENVRNKIELLEKKIDRRTNNSETEDPEEEPGKQYSTEKLKQKKSALEAHLSPIKKLVNLCEKIQTDQINVKNLAEELLAFIEEYLPVSDRNNSVPSQLEEAFENRLPKGPSEEIFGVNALQILESIFSGLKVTPPGDRRNGVYIGNLSGAQFRSFDALRIVHMTENSLPEIPREDPIFPDSVRNELQSNGSDSLRTSKEKAQEKLKKFRRVIRDTTDEVVFSSTNKDHDGQEIAPSSLFIDVCLASGLSEHRPPEDSVVEQLMNAGREEARKERFPIRASDQIKEKEEKGTILYPTSWKVGESDCRNLERITNWMRQKNSTNELGVHDGILESAIPDEVFPGLTSQNALSASSGRRFLKCPHRFLLKKILNYGEAPEPSPATELSSLQFGSVLHRVAERVYDELAESKIKEKGQAVEDLVKEEFDRYMRSEISLRDESIQNRERNRIMETLEKLIDMDPEEDRMDREYVTEEKLEAVHQITEEREVSLFGYLDRIDIDESGLTEIRDIKTGKPKTDDEFLHKHDIQLGIYYWLAQEGNLANVDEVQEVSFLYPAVAAPTDRTFSRYNRDEEYDLDQLMDQVNSWLELIHRMQNERAFVRTTDEDDCRYCPYTNLCGSDAQARSEEKLSDADPAWKDSFLERRNVDMEE